MARPSLCTAGPCGTLASIPGAALRAGAASPAMVGLVIGQQLLPEPDQRRQLGYQPPHAVLEGLLVARGLLTRTRGIGAIGIADPGHCGGRAGLVDWRGCVSTAATRCTGGGLAPVQPRLPSQRRRGALLSRGGGRPERLGAGPGCWWLSVRPCCTPDTNGDRKFSGRISVKTVMARCITTVLVSLLVPWYAPTMHRREWCRCRPRILIFPLLVADDVLRSMDHVPGAEKGVMGGANPVPVRRQLTCRHRRR